MSFIQSNYRTFVNLSIRNKEDKSKTGWDHLIGNKQVRKFNKRMKPQEMREQGTLNKKI